MCKAAKIAAEVTATKISRSPRWPHEVDDEPAGQAQLLGKARAEAGEQPRGDDREPRFGVIKRWRSVPGS